MGYWKSKVLPRIKKVFEKNGTKKAAAAEACKSFDDSKEEINKEFEEKKPELQPKVVEIYEASSAEIKTLVKDRKEDGLKKHSTAVHKLLEELVKIEFPGSKAVSEASSKFGAASVPGPVFFIFEKVSTFIVTEEKTAEPATAAAGEETKPEQETTSSSTAAVTEKDDVVVEEEKKEEAPAGPEKTEPAEAAAAPAPTEPLPAAAKEDQPAAAEPPKP